MLRRGEPLIDRLADVLGFERVLIGKAFAFNARMVRGDFLHAHYCKGAHCAHAAHTLVGCEYVFTRHVDNAPSNSWRRNTWIAKRAA